MAETTATNPAAESRDDLVWANEVLKVYRNLGARGTVRRLGSRSARHLHEWASNSENAEKFLGGMVPKATEIIAKHSRPEESLDLLVAEKRSILELKALLAEAVAKSSLVMP
jgi:2-polyprenyl-3-methyl-5-hydroxy-6-metoxy-1,4-benzoquinol methylase